MKPKIRHSRIMSILFIIFLLSASICSQAGDPPSGNLQVYPTVIYAGEDLTVFVEGSDDVRVMEVYSWYDGSWHRFDCTGTASYCNYTWTWEPAIAGAYEVKGFVRDDAGNGVASQPEKFDVLVLSVQNPTTSTALTHLSSTSTSSTLVTAHATTTSSTVAYSTTTSNRPPIDHLGIVGGFINDVVCTLLRLIWAVFGALMVLAIIFAGARYMSLDTPEARDKAKRSVLNAFIALVVVFAAIPVVTYLVKDTDIAGFQCGDRTPGTFTPTTVVTTVPTTTLPMDVCRIKAVIIGGHMVECGVDESFGGDPGICPEQFDPVSGGCPPGSTVVCVPPDPNC
ncbi:MAG: hypothetical protein JW724_04255 [Candidatus Altiarchaeota archaeon]|nr:hypothetical protein [Candidatus Altiarchaeota archaeon]